MTRRILLGYQLLTGASDTATGAMLILAPAFTLGLLRVHAPSDAMPFLSFIGAFVFSVGLSCFYGAVIVGLGFGRARIEMIWLLTAIIRSAVAIFITQSVLIGSLESAWLTVAVTDGAFALFQAIGMRKRWLAHAVSE